jgi:hypothetical protein
MPSFFANATTVADALSGKFNNAKTHFANVKDLLSDALKNILKEDTTIINNVNQQIKEIKEFLTNETKIKLDAFIENHTNVVKVIKSLNINITELGNDTNQSVECLYYETYEDIGTNNITTKVLTLSDAEGKRDLQKEYCNRLFQDNRTELFFISSKSSKSNSIGENIIALLRIISENRNDTELVNNLTTLRKQLQDYKDILYKYIIPLKCGETDIKGLYGGGSYKKTNKKNILGKERCIYKKSGDRKEYIKYKGNFIAVREYKKLSKTR